MDLGIWNKLQIATPEVQVVSIKLDLWNPLKLNKSKATTCEVQMGPSTCAPFYLEVVQGWLGFPQLLHSLSHQLINGLTWGQVNVPWIFHAVSIVLPFELVIWSGELWQISFHEARPGSFHRIHLRGLREPCSWDWSHWSMWRWSSIRSSRQSWYKLIDELQFAKKIQLYIRNRVENLSRWTNAFGVDDEICEVVGPG